MPQYIIRRVLLMLPTLLGILLVSFTLAQLAPGGPIETLIAQQRAGAMGDSSLMGATAETSMRGISEDLVAELEAQFGFDQPPHVRFVNMVKNYLTFNFGESYFRDVPVLQLIAEKLPVSLSLGFWTLLISYAIALPLGIGKAVREGTAFDAWTSTALALGYAIPNFLFGVLLIVVFAGGEFLAWFPLRGLVSDNWQALSWPARIADYFWHITLPVLALLISAFTTTTLLMKNAFLEEIRKQYVLTARAKGASERRIHYRHIFRNAFLVVLAGLPAKFMAVLFSGSLLIETIFSLDGLGLLSYEAILDRDFAVVFANLYVFALIGLLVQLLTDILYTVVDPRINFSAQSA